MKKDTWKGIAEDEIEKLSFEDFLKIVGSRERRTLLRVKSNPPLKNLMEKVKQIKAKNPKKMIKTHVREAVILPEWHGLTFGVYNGKEYKIFGESHIDEIAEKHKAMLGRALCGHRGTHCYKSTTYEYCMPFMSALCEQSFRHQGDGMFVMKS